MNAYQAAVKVAKAIDAHYGLDDGPEINQSTVWSKAKVREMGWDPSADAQVALEGPYEWTIAFTAETLGRELAALHAELMDAGIFTEPYNGWLLNFYKEA